MLDYEKKMRKLGQYKYVYRGWHRGEAPILKKDRAGACVYFDRKTNGCGIYKRRPLSCRAWFCGRGTKNNNIWKTLKERKGNGQSDRTRACP
jgi:Fe-S-cluster containining protein